MAVSRSRLVYLGETSQAELLNTQICRIRGYCFHGDADLQNEGSDNLGRLIYRTKSASVPSHTDRTHIHARCQRGRCDIDRLVLRVWWRIYGEAESTGRMEFLRDEAWFNKVSLSGGKSRMIAGRRGRGAGVCWVVVDHRGGQRSSRGAELHWHNALQRIKPKEQKKTAKKQLQRLRCSSCWECLASDWLTALIGWGQLVVLVSSDTETFEGLVNLPENSFWFQHPGLFLVSHRCATLMNSSSKIHSKMFAIILSWRSVSALWTPNEKGGGSDSTLTGCCDREFVAVVFVSVRWFAMLQRDVAT